MPWWFWFAVGNLSGFALFVFAFAVLNAPPRSHREDG